MLSINMKIILAIFVLFSSSVFAEDIADFEIEGMSIGDSLLDFYTKAEIETAANYDDLPSDMKFRITEIYLNSSVSDLYNAYQFYHIPDDKKFIIYGIRGIIDCSNNKDCDEIYNSVKNDLSIVFKDSKEIGPYTKKHPDDKSGKSKYTTIGYKLSNGTVNAAFLNWSNEVEYSDHVSVAISSNEVRDWLDSNYGLN